MSYLMDDLPSSAIFSRTGGKTMVTGERDIEMSILVGEAQLGNQQAFEILYERYNGQISRYLSRIVGDDGIGCELTQETFLKAWSSLPDLHSPASFVAWLYRIATNGAFTYRKRNAGRQQEVPLDLALETLDELHVDGPEQSIEESELLQLALARVSLTYRPCLILYIIEDLPQRKIAELLGIKNSCVSKYVSRGIEELRRIYYSFEGQGVSRSGRGKK